jgi:hypothetical protein
MYPFKLINHVTISCNNGMSSGRGRTVDAKYICQQSSFVCKVLRNGGNVWRKILGKWPKHISRGKIYSVLKLLLYGMSSGRGRTVDGFITIYAISVYHN